ncbi:DinB family protein [Ferruginibacter sp.]
MTKKYFLELAGYSNWTDHIIIEWLKQLSDEQWEQPITSSFSSIRQTAIHMVSAKKIWIDFWTNAANPVYLSAGFNGTKNELIGIWEKASADLKEMIELYPEENYQQPIRIRYPNGRTAQLEFSKTFLHFINHATYHRGQLVTMLRQAGFSNFSNTDLFTYYLLQE